MQHSHTTCAAYCNRYRGRVGAQREPLQIVTPLVAQCASSRACGTSAKCRPKVPSSQQSCTQTKPEQLENCPRCQRWQCIALSRALCTHIISTDPRAQRCALMHTRGKRQSAGAFAQCVKHSTSNAGWRLCSNALHHEPWLFATPVIVPQQRLLNPCTAAQMHQKRWRTVLVNRAQCRTAAAPSNHGAGSFRASAAAAAAPAGCSAATVRPACCRAAAAAACSVLLQRQGRRVPFEPV